MFFHMITLFLFLSLLILLIRIFSARLIIPAVGVFLPVSSLWMGFHMLTQNEAALIYSLKESNTLVLRIILISILFVGVISCAIYLYNLAISLFDSNPTSVQFTFCGVGCFIALLLQWISNVDANYRERIGDQPGTIKNIVQYLFAAIITISFITMALTAILVLKDSSNIWLNITFIALLLSIFVAIISVWG